jgi:hypothetical protein
MSAQTLLSGGDKWFSYSGVVFGDVSAPASIQLIFIPNTGLRDTLVQVQPFYGVPNTTGSGTSLGIEIKLNDVTIVKCQPYTEATYDINDKLFNLFIPRQSKLEIISLNTSGNNTQDRGCNVIGYYL